MSDAMEPGWALLHEGERSFGWFWMTAETLRSAGIPVRAGHSSQRDRLLPFFFALGQGVGRGATPDRLFVPEARLEQAREILDANRGPQGVVWVCGACGEENPPGFGLCWNCEAPQDKAVSAVQLAPETPRILANHHVLAVSDLEGAAAWLAELFGGQVEEILPDNWIYVQKDGTVFMVGRCPDAIPAVDLGDHQYFAYVVVDRVDVLYERARRLVEHAGGAILKVPQDEPWGMREMALRMPEGHRLMIARNIGRPSRAYPRS